MSQPNIKVWHLRIAENPRQEGETPYEYYRRMAVKYNTTFQNTRLKICKHLKEIKLAEANEKGYIPVIDKEGIDYGEVSHGWLKTTKADTNGHKHSLFFKVGHETDFIANVVEGLKGYEFQPVKVTKIIKADKIGLINIYDAHINKLSVYETTKHNSSIEDNVRVFREAFASLFDRCFAENVERIVFPIGNDFYNDDNHGFTTSGTPQDVYPDWSNSFTLGLNAIRWCVDYSISKGVKIDLVTIYSNHDKAKLWYLSKCLEIAYEKNEYVTLDFQRIQFKYYEYGRCMMAFAHGDTTKVNDYHNIMASDEPEMWGRTKHRSMWLGHEHTSKKYKYLNHEDRRGVEINHMRAMSNPDTWHHSKGYLGIPKSCTAHIIDKEKGIICNWIETF
jgi:hypothetical protein